MIAWSFASGSTGGRLREPGFYIVFDLQLSVKESRKNCVLRTFVTIVPARKNAASKMKKAPHGCIACTTAVAKAVAMPTGVRDLWDQARYTSAAISGAAISGLMAMRGCCSGALGGVETRGVEVDVKGVRSTERSSVNNVA